MVWDAATCCGNLNYKLDEPTSFFFRSFHSFLFFARAMACDKPVGLSPCASKGIFFHHCLRRLVLNKTHDREIPLRNSRMRINLDASMKKSQVESFLFVCQSVTGAATITNREPITLYFYGMNDSCHRIAWDVATCCGTLHSQHDEPMTSFCLAPHFFSSRRALACLVVLPIGPFMCLPIFLSLSPSTCVEQNA